MASPESAEDPKLEAAIVSPPRKRRLPERVCNPSVLYLVHPIDKAENSDIIEESEYDSSSEMSEDDDLEEPVASRKHTLVIDGFEWSLCARATERKVSVSVRCNSSNISRLWSCYAQVEIIIKSTKRSRSLHSKFESAFHRDDDVIVSVHKMDKIQSADYIFNDSHWVFLAKVKVIKEIGYRTHSCIDFLNPNPSADTVLVIEDKRFHVNKGILIANSTYFESLFGSNFVERENKEIELKNVMAEHFHRLLHVIYPSQYYITDSTVEYLLELADMFNIPLVLEKCELHLLDRLYEQDCVLRELLLAGKFSLPILLRNCLLKLTSPDQIKKIAKSSSFCQLNRTIQSFVYKSLMRFDYF